MTEEIIVDGVNVAGCDRLRTYRDWTYSSDKWCGISNDGGCECEQNVDCLYKQLKRLEQERDELKKQNKILEIQIDQCNEYIDELKQENKELKEDLKGLADIFDY